MTKKNFILTYNFFKTKKILKNNRKTVLKKTLWVSHLKRIRVEHGTLCEPLFQHINELKTLWQWLFNDDVNFNFLLKNHDF